MAPTHLGGPVNLAIVGISLCALYVVGTALYNVFLHPLRNYPGPFINKLSPIPRYLAFVRGRLHYDMLEYHKRYGTAVRISPNEVAFSSPQAWHDIYGHKKAGEEEFPKFEGFYRILNHLSPNVLSENRHNHGALRRQLAHGFSEKSMRAQEPIIGAYVDLLIQRLHETLNKNPLASLDMSEYYNWTTFDVIGDLAFGAPGGFGCLENNAYHPWVQLITDTIVQGAYFITLANTGFLTVLRFAVRNLKTTTGEHQAIVKEKVAQRMELGSERPDFLEGLLQKKSELNLDFDRLCQNASLLIIAGSETTATLLTGATFLLTTHPEVLHKLEAEVRSSFTSQDEITLTSVGNLSYMLAVLNESLRRYPPVAGTLPRVGPRGGGIVEGRVVPEGTVVSVFQWPINHNEKYWTDPLEFRPERWLGDEKYKNDRQDAMQPFSTGPRNCIGRNLAYAEMRLILAKIIFNFDMSLADSAKGWLNNQRAYILWHKPDLPIHLKPVVR
ncbi:putative cytochrome P450 monooxygenase [Xylariaceae sp. FL1019]|nr:putative cytochrome P450 monooxygenase [Xylariaceae sp. FL1019]